MVQHVVLTSAAVLDTIAAGVHLSIPVDHIAACLTRHP